MNKAYFLPLAIAAAVTTAANADSYTNFLTGVSAVSDKGTLTAVGGDWDQSGATVTKAGDKVADFETTSSPMRLTVTTPGPADTNTIVRVDLEVSLSDVGDFMTSLPAGAQVAFAVSTNAYNVWNGSGWVALDEVPAGVEDATTTNLTVELSYQGTNTKRKARFTVGGTILKLRSDGVTEWIELETTANNFTGLGINGSGTIAKADAEVMLGIAEYDGIKYGTLQEAVNVAAADETKGKAVDVLRPTSENINLTNNVVIADGGNIKGTITVPEGKEVDVVPNKEEFSNPETTTVAGTSGTYSIPVKVSGGTVNVVLPPTMSNKEIVGEPVRDGGAIKVTIQTATEVLADVKFDGKSLTNDVAKLRKFLEENATTTNAYVAADANATDIRAALAANGENKIPLYQSYALGIESTASVAPVSNDPAESGITLSIPTIDPAKYSGDYTIRYKVGNGAAQVSPSGITVPLTTGSHAVKIVFE